jgi:Ca2+-binding EF-hand superfamily protein
MKIEILKQELAGHDEFDSRIAFQLLDPRNRGFITLNDLNPIVSELGSGLSLDTRLPHELANFFKRYGNGEKLTYNE